MKSKLGAILANLALLAFSLGLSLGLCELVLYWHESRLLIGLPAAEDPAVFFAGETQLPTPADAFTWHTDGSSLLHIPSKDPQLVYELRPDARVNAFLSTNAQGFRDTEFALPKPAGLFRIVVLGDSVTFGWRVEPELVYTEILEDILNGLAKNGQRFDVCNLSVGGYNALQELAQLRTRVAPLDPDLVVVQYCVNDGLMGQDAGLWRHFSRSKLRTWDFVKLRIGNLCEWLGGETILERAYGGMAETVQSHRWPFLALIMPSAYPGEAGQWHFNEQDGAAMQTLLDALHLDSLYPISLFSTAEASLVLDDCVHLSEFGHRLAAEALFAHLAAHCPAVQTSLQGAPQPDFTPARDLYAAARRAEAHNDPEEALRRYKESAAADSGYRRLSGMRLALTARQSLETAPAQALVMARAAVELAPENVLAVQVFGLAANREGQYAEAVDMLGKAVALVPDNPSIWRELGRARLECGGPPEEFLDACRHALALEPCDPATYTLLDKFFSKNDGAFEQEAFYRGIVRDGGPTAAAALRLGAALEKQKHTDAAKTAYADAGKPDKGPAVWWISLGEARWRMDDFQGARAAFSAAYALSEDTVCRELDAAAASDGKLRPSFSFLWKRAAREPRDGALFREAGKCFATMRRTQQARDAYIQAIQCEPQDFPAAQALFTIERDQPENGQRIAFWAKITVEIPNSPFAQFFLGIELLSDKNNDAALAAFERSAQLYPAGPSTHRFIGETLLRLNRYGEAADAFAEALRLDPKTEGACEGQARALCLAGRRDDAQAAWAACAPPGRALAELDGCAPQPASIP